MKELCANWRITKLGRLQVEQVVVWVMGMFNVLMPKSDRK